MFKNLKIGYKIALVATIPVLGLLYFAISGIMEKTSLSNQMAELNQLGELGIRANDMVHELQKERGMSAGYLGSQGAKFGDDLPAQKSLTDKRVADWQTFLKTFKTADYGGDLENIIVRINSSLDQLNTKRASVRSLSSSVSGIVAYYSGTNAQLISIVSLIAKLSPDSEVTRQVTAFTNLLNMKERSGIERAVMSNVFAADKFDAASYIRFSELVNAESVYESNFMTFASEGEIDYFEQKMQGSAIMAVERFRKIAFDGADSDSLGVSAEEWFQAQTGRINQLKEVENRMAENLSATTLALKDNSQSEMFRAVWVTAILLLITISFAFFLTRGITKPLSSLVALAGKVSEGDLTAEIDVVSNDEVGQVSQAMGEVVTNLRKMFGQIAESSRVLASTSEEMSATMTQMGKGAERQAAASSQTSASMEEMSSQVQNVSENAMNLASNVEETSASIQEMVATIQEVGKNADTLVKSVGEVATTIEQMSAGVDSTSQNCMDMKAGAEKAATEARQGTESLMKVIHEIEGVATEMTQSGQTMERLGSQSEEIGSIVQVIEEIADQTNLLALNAAIEAARAGKAGEGFAVVAEEVRKLAERSVKSTKEIKDVIKAVQSGTADAVDTTRKNVQMVQSSASSVAEIGKMFDSMLLSSDRSLELINEITNSMQEQASSSKTVLVTVKDMNSRAMEVGNATREQSEGSESMIKATERMAVMTREVSDATVEQKKGGEQILEAVDNISVIARENVTAVEQMEKASVDLSKQATSLMGLLERFTY